MEKQIESMEETLRKLSSLDEKLSFLANSEEKYQAKVDDLSVRIDGMFKIKNDLEDRIARLENLLTDLGNALHRFDELKQTVDDTFQRIEKLDIQGLQSSLEETTRAIEKSEKALVNAEKRNKENASKKGAVKK